MTDERHTSPPSEPDELTRLLRHVSGEGTAGERADLLAWVNADPARSREAELLTALRTADIAPVIGIGADRAAPIGARRPLLRRRFAIAAAASVAMLAAGAALPRILPRLTTHISGFADTASPSRMRTFATAAGQRATITLHDGTRVTLNVASTLRVPADFGAATRDVFLDGEAYFEVAHDTTRRFTVHAAHAATDVLGTKFSVRAYPGEPVAEVVVAEGRVRLRPNDAPMTSVVPFNGIARGTSAILTHGMMGRLAEQGAPHVVTGISLADRLGWTEGRLVFHNVPLRDALPQIARWYALDLRLGDPALGTRRLVATFADDPLTDVVRMLEVALNVKAVRQGDVMILNARPPRVEKTQP